MEKLEERFVRREASMYVLCSLFATLTAIGAFIKVPLPVIPFTLQFLFTALAGVFLGAKVGALSQLIYVLVGLVGVPVFTKGGGLHYIVEPTFGYLIGFIVGAYVIGKCMARSGKLTKKKLFLAALAGLGVVYLFGVVYMYMIYNYYLHTAMTWNTAISVGAILCAPGDIFLCGVAALAGEKLLPVLRNNGWIKEV